MGSRDEHYIELLEAKIQSQNVLLTKGCEIADGLAETIVSHEAKMAKLTGALEKYGKHTGLCEVYLSRSLSHTCACGLDEAQAALSEPSVSQNTDKTVSDSQKAAGDTQDGSGDDENS